MKFGIDRRRFEGSMGAGEDVPRVPDVLQYGRGLGPDRYGRGGDQNDAEGEAATDHV